MLRINQMKVFHIIAEDEELDEFLGFGKTAKAKRQAKRAVKTDYKDMKRDLVAWMSGSGIAKGTLSVEDFKDFLGQKGLPNKDIDAMIDQDRQASGRDENEPLSNPEVDKLLQKSIQTGFKAQGAKGRMSKFGQQTPAMPPMRGGGAVSPDVQDAIDKLKAAGYNVSK
jgi:hypothetical protein